MDIALIIGVLGLIVTVIALKKDHFSRPKDEIEHLKIQFKATQILSLQVEKDLENFIINNYDFTMKEAWPGVTYNDYLDLIKQSNKEQLSDSILDNALSQKPTKNILNSYIKSLETQFENLNVIHTQIKILSQKY